MVMDLGTTPANPSNRYCSRLKCRLSVTDCHVYAWRNPDVCSGCEHYQPQRPRACLRCRRRTCWCCRWNNSMTPFLELDDWLNQTAAESWQPGAVRVADDS